MSTSYSDLMVLALYFLVFLSQILLLSVYYPIQICNRVLYVLDHYPPAKYPKLYPHPFDVQGQNIAQNRWLIFKIINYLIAGVGLLILAVMLFSGYKPDPKGGSEIIVIWYFLLQILPILYLSIREFSFFRSMRKVFTEKIRTAELTRRKIFDFISPLYIITAILFYLSCMTMLIVDYEPISDSKYELALSLTLSTFAQLILPAGIIFKYLYGKKINPYQNSDDRLLEINTIVKVNVFSSNLAGLFLLFSLFADRFALEIFDPPATSIFMQLIVFFGIRVALRNIDIKTVNFEVYRNLQA